MPLIAIGADYVPIFHLGAVGGIKPPYWDQHDEFGDTNMLVVKPEEGASLARALGKHSMVLMRRHGVTVIGANVRECVYRAVQTCRNAEFQVRGLGDRPEHRLAFAGRNRALWRYHRQNDRGSRAAGNPGHCGLPRPAALPASGQKRLRAARARRHAQTRQSANGRR